MKLPSLQSLLDPSSISEFTKKYQYADINFKNWHEQPEEIKTRENVLKLLALKKNIFPALSSEMKDDIDIYNEASKHYMCFGSASFKIRCDKNIINTITKIDPFSIQYVSNNIKKDEQFIVQWFKELPFIPVGIFDNLPYVYRDNNEIAEIVVNENYQHLKALSTRIKDDKKFILNAVEKNGLALQYASQALKNDKDIVLSAINNHINAYVNASEDLKNDIEIIDYVMEKDSIIYWALPEKFKDNETYVSKVFNNPQAIYNAYESIPQKFKNRENALKVVKNAGYFLSKMPEYQDYVEIVSQAVQNSGDALRYASKRLKNDYSIVFNAVSQNGLALQYASDNFKNDKQLAIWAINKNADAIKYVSDTLKKDKEVVLASYCKNNGDFFINIDNLIDENLLETLKNSNLPYIDYLKKSIFEEKVTAQKERLDAIIPHKNQNKNITEKKKKI